MMNEMIIAKQMRTAIKQHDLNRVAELIEGERALLSQITPFGSWLHVAATVGDLNIVKLLISWGIGVNIQGGQPMVAPSM